MRDRITFSSSRPGAAARPHVGRLAAIAFAMLAVTLALGVATAHASLLSPTSTFGSAGSGADQLKTPAGVAIDPSTGDVYVTDSGNARVDEFGPGGNFIAAFGWGVADGRAHSEVCGASDQGSQGNGPLGCRAGISGSGPGQFSDPASVAFVPSGQNDNAGGSVQGQGGTLYVGDAGSNNVVEKFTADGNFQSTIDGTTTPQGHFSLVAGVAVDQSGNLWTADGSTDNIDEFDPTGKFVQQWTDPFGVTIAIAVDSTNNAVYLTRGSGATERFTLTGGNETVIDNGSGVALAVDQRTGNLYIDHGVDVTTYNRRASQVESLTLSTSNSQGLAFGSGDEESSPHLYVSDASANNVTTYSPPRTPGAPIVAGALATGTNATRATLSASVVPLGHDTTCTFQYVDDTDFQASGYTNATSVPCTPADLGSGFTYQFATSAPVTGLTVGATYHFRAVATNSAGTTTGADTQFQAGSDAWTPFTRCPVDDPTMLATTGGTLGLLGGGTGTSSVCVASTSTHGSITIGTITTATGNVNLQVGAVHDASSGLFPTIVAPTGGALVADPVQLSTPIGPVTAVTESAGTPSNFNPFAGLQTGQPIITVPIKIQLANNPTLGPSCFIGTDQNPILLNPENTDLSNATEQAGGFEPDGTPNDIGGALASIVVSGAVQGDSTFAVPGATGCGTNDSLDAAVNAVAGLPSPSGSNHLVLDGASSAIAFAGNPLAAGNFGPTPVVNGQQFAADWHVGLG